MKGESVTKNGYRTSLRRRRDTSRSANEKNLDWDAQKGVKLQILISPSVKAGASWGVDFHVDD